MRYLNFNTPKSVMRSIFYDCLISVRGACACVGRVEVGILIVLLSADEGSVKIAVGGISCQCIL